MKVTGFAKCFFSRHCIVDQSESIVSDIMIDKRNYLCKCQRCGLYVMHDGAISGLTSRFMSEKEAFRIKSDFERLFKEDPK